MSLRVFLSCGIVMLATPVSLADETDTLQRQLEEVVVTADQSVTHLEGTTLVSVIAGSPLQHLGTALDMLGQLPMISTSDGGEVSVAGKGAPEIYIDGRPMRGAEELLQLQSSDVRKVELLMAPGVAYGNTVGAVLRITTWRDRNRGFSLTERAVADFRRRLSANNLIDVNYRQGDWDLFVSGLVDRSEKVIKGSTVSRLFVDGNPVVVGSSQRNSSPSVSGIVKAGFNYNHGDRAVGAYYRYNPEYGDFLNRGSEWIDDETPLSRRISRTMRSHGHLGALYYDDRFASGVRLHFDGDFSLSGSDTDVATVYPDGGGSDVASTSARASRLWAAKFYAGLPAFGGELTVGTQDSWTSTSLDYRMLNQQVGQYIPSEAVDTRQASAALFASWTGQFGPVSLTAGLRYEYVDFAYRRDGVRNRDLSRTDHLLTPDISLTYTPDERTQLALSYRMATVRPPYSQLTGALNYVGRHEIEGGNPALRDEHMHHAQLFAMRGDFMLQADFTRSIDTYAFVKRMYPAPTLQLLLQPENVDVSSLDLYLMWSHRVGRWTPNVVLGTYAQRLAIDGTRYRRPIFSYDFENTLAMPWGLLLTVNLRGQTSGDMHTNRFAATWLTANASLSRSFRDKTMDVRISVTDIFNTADNDWSMRTYGVNVDKRQSYDRRGVSVSFTYRFRPVKSRYKGSAASEAELNRL